MLKITIIETSTERKWVLAGRLVEPWVKELRTTWKRRLASYEGRACIIDLNEVTFIDKAGERLLRALCRKGAQLVANGLYTKHVVEKVKISGKRDVPKLLVWLFVAFFAHTMIVGTSGAVLKAGNTIVTQALSVMSPRNVSILNKAHSSIGEGTTPCARTS